MNSFDVNESYSKQTKHLQNFSLFYLFFIRADSFAFFQQANKRQLFGTKSR